MFSRWLAFLDRDRESIRKRLVASAGFVPPVGCRRPFPIRVMPSRKTLPAANCLRQQSSKCRQPQPPRRTPRPADSFPWPALHSRASFSRKAPPDMLAGPSLKNKRTFLRRWATGQVDEQTTCSEAQRFLDLNRRVEEQKAQTHERPTATRQAVPSQLAADSYEVHGAASDLFLNGHAPSPR